MARAIVFSGIGLALYACGHQGMAVGWLVGHITMQSFIDFLESSRNV